MCVNVYVHSYVQLQVHKRLLHSTVTFKIPGSYLRSSKTGFLRLPELHEIVELHAGPVCVCGFVGGEVGRCGEGCSSEC